MGIDKILKFIPDQPRLVHYRTAPNNTTFDDQLSYLDENNVMNVQSRSFLIGFCAPFRSFRETRTWEGIRAEFILLAISFLLSSSVSCPCSLLYVPESSERGVALRNEFLALMKGL